MLTCYYMNLYIIDTREFNIFMGNFYAEYSRNKGSDCSSYKFPILFLYGTLGNIHYIELSSFLTFSPNVLYIIISPNTDL